ncbi:MAG: SpoIIIAH-like family protein [Eubacteriales bacterium]|nr:SpoIIIAH-like family protein [Eubacteriales bacterium]
MLVFKRKQIVVLALALMIVVAGYLQYSYNRSSQANKLAEKGRLGEAVYVDEETLDNADASTEEDLPVSNVADNYFAQAKLDREITRSRNSDSYRQITEDANVSAEIKTEAYNRMIKIIENTEKEMRLENLIKEKGFSDAMAMFGEDGSVDIIVEAESLSQADVAQIADIAMRHAGISMTDIQIKGVH